jgi:hypothetical protein
MMKEVEHFHVNGSIHKQFIFINDIWNVGNIQLLLQVFIYFKLKKYSLYSLFYSVLIYVYYVQP